MKILAAALIALLILSGVTQRRRPRPALGELAAPLEQAVFLFDRDELVDATGAGAEREAEKACVACSVRQACGR